MLGRPLSVGDYVIFYNHIYQVKSVPLEHPNEHGYVQILLMDKSETTRRQRKYSREMYLIHKDDLLVWKLKNGK